MKHFHKSKAPHENNNKHSEHETQKYLHILSALSLVLCFILILITPLPSYSQHGQNNGGNYKEMPEKMKIGHLYGKVIDSITHKSVEYAAVQLSGNVYDTVKKVMRQDVVVAGQLTQENGEFRLEKINVTLNYKLKILH